MALDVEQVLELYRRKGERLYTGEPVTQLEHALQSAQLAEQAGAAAPLVAASLLHDIGHMINDQGETPTLRGVDDLHQYVALPFLRALFPDAVLEPIRLHVDAKRYLCAVEPAYHDALSQDSIRSLALQGGVFSAAQAAQFIAQPFAQDAARLRRWDDEAKSAGKATPPLAHFASILHACARAA